jgi:hypothetical protein
MGVSNGIRRNLCCSSIDHDTLSRACAIYAIGIELSDLYRGVRSPRMHRTSIMSKLHQYRVQANVSTKTMADALKVDEATVLLLEGNHGPSSASHDDLTSPAKLDLDVDSVSTSSNRPNTDADYWGRSLAAVAMMLGRPVQTLVPSGEQFDSFGARTRAARGDKPVDQAIAGLHDAMTREQYLRCEAGGSPLETTSVWLSRWAEACDVPLATLVF